MNNIGKCLDDIPVNKIYEGMRLLYRYGNDYLAKISFIKRNIFLTHCYQFEDTKGTVLGVEFDNGALVLVYLSTDTDYSPYASKDFYFAEEK